MTIVEPTIDRYSGDFLYDSVVYIHDTATFSLLESLAGALDRRGKGPGEGVEVVNYLMEYNDHGLRHDLWRSGFDRWNEANFGYATEMFERVGIQFFVQR